MKSIFTTLFVCVISMATAQNVGINTNSPRTTLQVIGTPGTASVADGITLPKLTGNQLRDKDAAYTSSENGTLVYVTAAASPTSPQTINVTSAGLYYLDGIWHKVINAAGADITNDAFVNDNANTMVKLGTNADGVTARASNTDFVIKDNGRVGISTNNPAAPLDVAGKVLATDEIQVRRSSTEGGQIILQGQNAGADLNWSIDQINNSSNPRFRIFAGNNESNGIAIKENGNLGVGTGDPGQKIAANGNITATGWIRGLAPGQLLNSVFIDDPTLRLTSTTSNTFVDLISENYTPVYNNSKIMVQYHNNNYKFDGNSSSSSDGFESVLLINSSTITTNYQVVDNGNFSRSSILFPITGVSTNSGTSTITIKVQVRRAGSDDALHFYGTNGTLIIQEIAN